MSAPIAAATFATGAAAPDFDILPAMPADGDRIGLVAGTRVATPMGYVPVETLRAGDHVLTVDGGRAPLMSVDIALVAALGADAPVCIATGVMDNMRPLRLAQGHRLRFAGWQAQLLFSAEAVLATAKSFVNGTDIVIETSAGTVAYVSLRLDHHAVILAENIACETCHAARDGVRPQAAGDCAGLPILSAAEEAVLQAA